MLGAPPHTRLARGSELMEDSNGSRTCDRDQLDLTERLRRCHPAGHRAGDQDAPNVRSAWVNEQRVHIKDGQVVDYQVNLMVTFVLED